MDNKRKNGEFIGSFAPYGYAKSPKDGHKLVIDEEAAQIVRDIYTWFIGGMSKRGIAEKLNGMGIPNPTGYKRLHGSSYNGANKSTRSLWGMKTIHDILANRMYTGYMVQGRYRIISYKNHKQISPPSEEWFVVPGMHEPIIPLELFEKARKLASRDTRSAPGKDVVYLFSGFLRCGDCGRPLNRKTSGKSVYYICKTYKDYSRTACSSHSIGHNRLEKAVFAAVKTLISVAAELEHALSQVKALPKITQTETLIQGQIVKMSQELRTKSHCKKSLYEDWKRGDISQEEYHEMKAQFVEEEQEISRKLASLQKQAEQKGQDSDGIVPALQTYIKHQALPCLTRDILIDLIEFITVFEDNRIQIQFKFADIFLAANAPPPGKTSEKHQPA